MWHLFTVHESIRYCEFAELHMISSYLWSIKIICLHRLTAYTTSDLVSISTLECPLGCVGINGLCWVAYVFSLLSLDPLSLLGIKEPLYRVMEWYVVWPELLAYRARPYPSARVYRIWLDRLQALLY